MEVFDVEANIKKCHLTASGEAIQTALENNTITADCRRAGGAH